MKKPRKLALRVDRPIQERARSFRKNMTEAEYILWNFLRSKRLDGYKFIREHAIDPYIVDFLCREKKLVIELDGSQHADLAVTQYDELRTIFLEENGYKVLRFENNVVLNDVGVVLYKIVRELKRR